MEFHQEIGRRATIEAFNLMEEVTPPWAALTNYAEGGSASSGAIVPAIPNVLHLLQEEARGDPTSPPTIRRPTVSLRPSTKVCLSATPPPVQTAQAEGRESVPEIRLVRNQPSRTREPKQWRQSHSTFDRIDPKGRA